MRFKDCTVGTRVRVNTYYPDKFDKSFYRRIWRIVIQDKLYIHATNPRYGVWRFYPKELTKV